MAKIDYWKKLYSLMEGDGPLLDIAINAPREKIGNALWGHVLYMPLPREIKFTLYDRVNCATIGILIKNNSKADSGKIAYTYINKYFKHLLK